MTSQYPHSSESFDGTTLPDLSLDVVTRLVAGRCYDVDLPVSTFRRALALAQAHRLTMVPAGCEADLSGRDQDLTIQGPFVVGKPVVWTSASVGPSEPFDADEVQQVAEAAFATMDAAFESRLGEVVGPAHAIDAGVFLCSTGPLATGTLVFGVAGTRDEAELTGGEYVWGHDMQKLPHETGIIGEVIASVELDEVEAVDFSMSADARRRQASVPYADEPVYFLVAQYD